MMGFCPFNHPRGERCAVTSEFNFPLGAKAPGSDHVDTVAGGALMPTQST